MFYLDIKAEDGQQLHLVKDDPATKVVSKMADAIYHYREKNQHVTISMLDKERHLILQVTQDFYEPTT